MIKFVWIVAALIALIVLEPIFSTGLLVDAIFRLLLGWIFYLKRVIPNIEWNSQSIFSGVVFAGLTVGGLHYVGRALSSASSKQWRWSWTWMIALMTCIAFAVPLAAGSIAHQAAWMTRNPLIVSNHTHRAKSINNARQLITALSLYHTDKNKLPDSLEELIDSKILDHEGFRKIAFATSDGPEMPQPWIYIKPIDGNANEDLPVLISPFEHKKGVRIVGYTNLTVSMVGLEELKQLLPQWKKRCTELGIMEPFIFQEMDQSLANAGIQ